MYSKNLSQCNFMFIFELNKFSNREFNIFKVGSKYHVDFVQFTL